MDQSLRHCVSIRWPYGIVEAHGILEIRVLRYTESQSYLRKFVVQLLAVYCATTITRQKNGACNNTPPMKILLVS